MLRRRLQLIAMTEPGYGTQGVSRPSSSYHQSAPPTGERFPPRHTANVMAETSTHPHTVDPAKCKGSVADVARRPTSRPWSEGVIVWRSVSWTRPGVSPPPAPDRSVMRPSLPVRVSKFH